MMKLGHVAVLKLAPICGIFVLSVACTGGMAGPGEPVQVLSRPSDAPVSFFDGDQVPPFALDNNPCARTSPDPTPVPPSQTPTQRPTYPPEPLTPTPTPTGVPVPGYPPLPVAIPESISWGDAVVGVELEYDDRSEERIQGLVVDPGGVVATSLEPPDRDPYRTVTAVRVTIDDKEYPARLWRYDPLTNVALLRIEASGLAAAPREQGEISPGEPGMALERLTDGSLRASNVLASPSVNAPDSLVALLGRALPNVAAGVTITDREGRIVGITQRAIRIWMGVEFFGGPAGQDDQPIVRLDAVSELLGGVADRSEAAPAALAYHGVGWGYFADGPVSRALVGGEVQALLGSVGEPVAVENLGRRALWIIRFKTGTYLELLFARPQLLRTANGEVVGQARYLVFWWRRDAELPDLLLCGQHRDHLGAAFAMPTLGHLEQIMERAPKTSRSAVLAESIPVRGDDGRNYPYRWALIIRKGSYERLEPLRFTVRITNISSYPMPLDFTPPMVLIRDRPAGRVVAVIPHGEGHGTLAPGQTTEFEMVWNGRLESGEPAPPGGYLADALIANAWGQNQYGLNGPGAEFAITER